MTWKSANAGRLRAAIVGCGWLAGAQVMPVSRGRR
ncbi:hypothetical protein FHT86_004702 [Rhizobium sp. BK313]|nr:hypothetical protein [Rhizobium sp. BK313]